jgi:hypothetical protein
LLAAEKSVEFFKITRTYRIAITRENQSSSRAIANAVTLQEITQDQAKNESFNQNEQRSINKNKSKEHNHSINQKKDEKCICEEEHFFKKCSYIVKSNRKKE